MKTNFTLRKGLLLAFILTLSAPGFAQVAGDYRTYNGAAGTTNANTNTKANWEMYDGAAWVSSPTYVPLSSSGILTVLQTCTFASGDSAIIFSGTDTSLNAIRTNQFVTATAPDVNIAAGTKVGSFSGTTVNLNKPTIAASGTAVTKFTEQLAISCNGTSGSATLTFPSGTTDALAAGMCVTNANIPVGTTILSVDSDTQVTLSANATAAVTTATFFTKETTAATTAGSTTITLAAANSLVAVGMIVYSSGYVSYGSKVVSVSGNTIVLSIPATATTAATGLLFGYQIIPNLYINGPCTVNSNAVSATIGNVYVNNTSNAYNAGSTGAIISSTVNPIFTVGNGTSATVFVCKTLSIAAGATVRTNQSAGSYLHSLYLAGGEGGNAITNNGTLNFVSSTNTVTPHKTNIYFTHVGNTTVSGSGTYNQLSILVPGSTVTFDTNSSVTGGTIAQGGSIILTNGAVLTGSNLITLKTNSFNQLDSKIKLWPNPAHNQFNILNEQEQQDGATKVEISTLSGQIIYSQKLDLTSTTAIQTTGWANGIYLVKMTNKGVLTTRKLIIQ